MFVFDVFSVTTKERKLKYLNEKYIKSHITLCYYERLMNDSRLISKN